MNWIHIVRYAFLPRTFVYRMCMFINMCTNAETNRCQCEMQGGKKNPAHCWVAEVTQK